MSSDGNEKVRLRSWWERWPGLLEEELQQFEHRGLPVTLLSDPRRGAGRLAIETSLHVAEHGDVRLIVLYPDGFPDRRFSIYGPDLRLGRHQAFGGNLCVMPRESASWDPWFKAADIIVDRIPRLIELVDTGGEPLRAAEDPQGEPVTTYYDSLIQGGVVFDDRAVADAVVSAGGGTLNLRHVTDDATWLEPMPDPVPDGWSFRFGLIYLAAVSDEDDSVVTTEVPEFVANQFPIAGTGRWTYVARPPRATSPQELWDFLEASDGRVARWASSNSGMQILGMCTREEVRQGEYEPTWVFLARRVDEPAKANNRPGRQRSGNPAKRSALRIHAPVFVRGLRRTDEALSARIPELAGMRRRTVAVVGLGSLGAPLAQELIKGRLGEIRLVDSDHLDPATAVRHPLGLPDAGMSKPLALAKWSASNHPEVEVSGRILHIGATPLDDTGLTELGIMQDVLDGVDLLVSAAAEHDVNRQLDTFARELDIPRLYAWSQSGYGGVVALLTSESGCYHCLELLLSQAAEDGTPLVSVPPDGPHGTPAGTIQSPGCADKTFTAPHADLLPIAIHAARVAYGLLSSGEPDGYPCMDGDVFTVQIRELDATPIPPRWTVHHLEPHPSCRTCNAS